MVGENIATMMSDGGNQGYTGAVTLIIVNLLLCAYSFAMVCTQCYYSWKILLKSIWVYFDILYIISNTFVSICLLDRSIMHISHVRSIEAFLSVVIIIKFVYFTQLIDGIAPLISIIIQIFIDIGWFMLILIIIIFAFAFSFYLIGRN